MIKATLSWGKWKFRDHKWFKRMSPFCDRLPSFKWSGRGSLLDIPRVVADAGLAAEVQTTLDRLGLQELKKYATRSMDLERAQQKKAFDASRSKSPQCNVGDVVIVVAGKVVAGKSKELTAKAKGPFKVTAILPNDRYEVQDLRNLKKSPNQWSTVSVNSFSKWVTFDTME